MEHLELRDDNFHVVVQRVVDSARRGELMVFPTDTVFGLGGIAFSRKVFEKLKRVKPEREAKPTAVLIASILSMSQCAGDVPGPKIVHLADKYWPGPLTLVWKTSGAVPDEFQTPDRSLGYRVPKSEFMLAVLRELGVPMWATSANLPGKRPPALFSELSESVLAACDLVIKTDKFLQGKASTVVDVRQREPIVLREGSISEAEILQAWKQG